MPHKDENPLIPYDKTANELEYLLGLTKQIREKEQRYPINFNDFLFLLSTNPKQVLRNIFQLFHDMVHYYVPEGTDEYENDSENVGFSFYDLSKLLVENVEVPFFSDRLFANRFMQMAEEINKGINVNQIYLFEGPPGSGKSTFLNNLLQKMQEYTLTDEGTVYKIFWKIDTKDINNKIENGKIISYSCPHNDNPFLIIPKELRKDFLKTLIKDPKVYEDIIESKIYEWLFRSEPCSICKSIYNSLIDILEDPLQVYDMIYAKRIDFNRQLGKGLSVWNPADNLIEHIYINDNLQNELRNLLSTEEIECKYSYLAYTNNGIYAIMDIKDNNITRLLSLHGIISDGVHKVEHIEERINTLFLGLVNPEAKKTFIDIKSFQDRVRFVLIPYVLDAETEVRIYENKFGSNIQKKFLPRVLQNFAKIIICTRLNTESDTLKRWLKHRSKYEKYIDPDLLLLKMELYHGRIPRWLEEEDIQGFKRNIRLAVLNEALDEGFKGISGRQSIALCNKLLSTYQEKDEEIDMLDIINFFNDQPDSVKKLIPPNFINSLLKIYEINIVQELKDALFTYNENKILEDIIHYLLALSYDIGAKVTNPFTDKTYIVTNEFLESIENRLFPEIVDRDKNRNNLLNRFITETLAQEIEVKQKKWQHTQLIQDLFDLYKENIKKASLDPYLKNQSFRFALKDYFTDKFGNYDNKIQEDIRHMISVMCDKYGYSERGAIKITLYIIDRNLPERHKEYLM
jgi:predicted Ser/Thr protein kinase